MRISDWSSDVCSSDLEATGRDRPVSGSRARKPRTGGAVRLISHPPPVNVRRMSFEESCPRYLREHSRPATRRVHVLGTGAAILLLLGAILNAGWRLAVIAVVVGYGRAWHRPAFLQRNR